MPKLFPSSPATYGWRRGGFARRSLAFCATRWLLPALLGRMLPGQHELQAEFQRRLFEDRVSPWPLGVMAEDQGWRSRHEAEFCTAAGLQEACKLLDQMSPAGQGE